MGRRNAVMCEPEDQVRHHDFWSRNFLGKESSWEEIMHENRATAPPQHQRHHTLFDIVGGKAIIPIM
jgi:hypothetical protein